MMTSRYFTYTVATLTLLCFGSVAQAEVNGTPFSLTYRGPSTATGSAATASSGRGNRIYPGVRLPTSPTPARTAGGVVRLIDARTGNEIGRSTYDAQLGGYFFSLPMRSDLAGSVCLMLKGSDGSSLPVRDESPEDDGYEFRHPAWEEAMNSVTEAAQLNAERAQLEKSLSAQRSELDMLQVTMRERGESPTAECRQGSVLPEPVRPAEALDASALSTVAANLCRQRLLSSLSTRRVQADALVADALPAGSSPAAEITDSFPRLDVGFSDTELLTIDAATKKGKLYLDYSEALRILRAKLGTCGAEVKRAASEALRRWEADRLAALNNPVLSLQACEVRKVRLSEIERTLQAGSTYLTALNTRVGKLSSRRQTSSEAQRLDNLTCNRR